MPVWRQLMDRLSFAQRLHRRIAQAGLSWPVGRVTLAMLFLGSLGFALVLDATWTPPGAPIAAFCAASCLPYWLIQHKRKKRLAALERQFPDALDSMARALRAGHALPGAIAMLGSETPAPLGPEFRKIAEEHRLGIPWKSSLAGFSERVPSTEVRLFVAALMVQTRSGGRLTEVLERLAETIRESSALTGEVRAISAHGKLTGMVLTALPLVIAAAMLATNPGYLGLLLKNPTGNTLVWCAGACLALGHLAIQRIVDVKAPH